MIVGTKTYGNGTTVELQTDRLVQKPIHQKQIKSDRFEMDQSREFQTKDSNEQRNKAQMKVKKEQSQDCRFLRILALFRAPRISPYEDKYSDLPLMNSANQMKSKIITELLKASKTEKRLMTDDLNAQDKLKKNIQILYC